MTGAPDNFFANLPPGLDEVDLLAWVEGDALPRNREVAVARLLSEHPALARQLDAMRRDRAMLRSLPAEERAPAGLLSGVEAALQPLMERQMLLGLRDGEAVDEHPPVSLVLPARRSIFDVMLGGTGRRLAMAAGLLLLVGGTTYFAATMFSGGSTPAPGPLAQTDTRSDAHDAVVRDDSAEDVQAVAALDTVEGTALDGPGVLMADSGAAGEADEAAEPAAVVAVVEDVAEVIPDSPMTTEQALRLAQDNRLVIRVKMGEGVTRPDRVVDRLRGVRSAGWRYSGEAPEVLVAAVTVPVLAPDPLRIRPPHEVMADRSGPPPAEFEPPIPTIFIELPASRTGVYVVQARLEAAAFESLRTALRGVSAEVIFEEMDESLPAVGEMGHSLAPSAVLWWGQPPAAWTWWTSVPVVVEPRR